jgi:hypothetical protein
MCDCFAQFPVQKGESHTLTFPDGFKIAEVKKGQFDAGKGDVMFALARDEQGHEIRAFHASHVPVSNEEIGKFVEATAAFYAARIQGLSVVSKKVEDVRGRNWGRVVMTRGDRCMVMAFYSMDGSPTRIEFHGRSDEAEKLLGFLDVMVKKFDVPKKEDN